MQCTSFVTHQHYQDYFYADVGDADEIIKLDITKSLEECMVEMQCKFEAFIVVGILQVYHFLCQSCL